MIVRCIDFETTGEPEPEEIVEVGWRDVAIDDKGAALVEAGEDFLYGSLLVNPGRPIAPGARGVHHIKDAWFEKAVERKEALRLMMTWRETVPDVICAHEVRFEQKLWTTSKRPWLCTRKAALRIWPNAPDHKLQTLRYFLEVKPAFEITPHRAGPDAYVGALILLKCLEHEPVEQLIEWTEVPSLLPVCNLKKHKGKAWEDVPDDYLQWMLKQEDMDEDLKFTARHHLEARKPKRAY